MVRAGDNLVYGFCESVSGIVTSYRTCIIRV